MRRENGDGYARRKTHDNGVGDELNESTKFQRSHYNEQDASHKGRYNKSVNAIALDNAVNNDDKCACRPPYLYIRASQEGNDEATENGGEDAHFGRNAARNAEGYS